MDANAAARTVNFPAPAGYEGAFALPDSAQARPMRSTTGMAPATQTHAADAASLAGAASSYAPMGVGVVAAVLMVGLAWNYLKSAGARIRAIAVDDRNTHSAVRLPVDDHASRTAFEARYGRELPR